MGTAAAACQRARSIYRELPVDSFALARECELDLVDCPLQSLGPVPFRRLVNATLVVAFIGH
jgi:hypothetical protein